MNFCFILHSLNLKIDLRLKRLLRNYQYHWKAMGEEQMRGLCPVFYQTTVSCQTVLQQEVKSSYLLHQHNQLILTVNVRL